MRNPISSSIALMLLGLASSAASLSAATHVWSGASSGNWSQPANWSSGGVPSAGEANLVLQFPAGATTKSMNNDIAGLTITSMSFAEGGYALAGSAVTMAGSISLTGGGAARSDVNVSMTLTQDLMLSAASGKLLALVGAIAGPFGLSVTGPGTVSLEVGNAYSGPTTVNSATLEVRTPTALGTADGTAATGTSLAGANARIILFTSAPPLTVTNERLTMANQTVLRAAAASVWAGPIDVAGQGKLETTSFPLTVSGVIGGPGGLNFFSPTPAGPVILTGSNTYAGLSQTNAGTAFANGSQPGSSWQIGFGSLGGSGTVGTVQHGGSSAAEGLRPGPGPSLPGTLTIQGSLAMALGGMLEIDVQGTAAGQYDRVKVNGLVEIPGVMLTLVPTVGVPVGTQLLILDNDGADPINGTFAGLAEGATAVLGGQSFQVTYIGGTGNDVVLTRIAGVPVELQSFDAD